MTRIEYALKDIDDNIFNLNESANTDIFSGSLTYSDDSISNENNVVEKSSCPGAVKLGKTRTQSRELSFEYSRTAEGIVASVFTADENELLYNFNKAVYLIDVTHDKQIKIAPSSSQFSYDPGSHKLSGSGSLSFILLEPFWTALTATTYSLALSIGNNPLPVTNAGYVSAPPVITFTAAVAVDVIKAYVDETKEGIRIDNDVFGTLGFTEMIVDCEAGLASIDNADINNDIVAGTGFFEIPVGTVDLIFNVNALCDVQVDFNERTYI